MRAQPSSEVKRVRPDEHPRLGGTHDDAARSSTDGNPHGHQQSGGVFSESQRHAPGPGGPSAPPVPVLRRRPHGERADAVPDPVREPPATLSAPYQTERVPVKTVVRENSPADKGTPPCSMAADSRKMGSPAPKAEIGKTNWPLLEARVREYLRVAHYSYRTEQTYLGWIRQFVAFHQGQKPSTMDAGHVRDFLRHLAMDRQVASSTQDQAAQKAIRTACLTRLRPVHCCPCFTCMSCIRGSNHDFA